MSVKEQPASAALSAEETKLFCFYETVVKEGRSSRPFYEVGTALKEIRDHKLYREDYETFEECCRERWRFSRIHAHRLIEATTVAQNLLPIGNKPHPDIRESQFRPLISLDPDQQRQAWEAAVEASENGNPTAVQVQRAVETIKLPDVVVEMSTEDLLSDMDDRHAKKARSLIEERSDDDDERQKLVTFLVNDLERIKNVIRNHFTRKQKKASDAPEAAS